MMDENTLAILLYHGVTSDVVNGSVVNNSGKHITVVEFQKQMEFIKRHCVVLSMDDVVEIYASREPWPKNAVAVTFDDGFQNNFINAAPILDDCNVPATFYICAGMVNTDLMFWVDEIEDCINRTNRVWLRMKLGADINFSLQNSEDKISAINTVKKYCKSVDAVAKNRVIAELIEQTEVTPDVNQSTDYRMMNWKQLKAMNSCSLFTIGGHTLYHDIMSAQEPKKLEQDVRITQALLDFNLNQTTKHFAYPEGQLGHYNENVISVLKNNGVICCPSAIDGVNKDEDLFNLKRIMPNFMGRSFPYNI